MLSAKVVVMGSINVDLVVRSRKLPQPGETVLGGHFAQYSGGKGANQAVAAARASIEPVALIGAVGDDAFGSLALAALRAENLDLRFVRQLPNSPSGVALIMVDEAGENAISVAAGANASLAAAEVDNLPSDLFAKAAVFLASLEAPLPAVARALERAKAAGCLTILNPAPADRAIIERDVLSLVDILTPNESEALELATGLSSGTPTPMVAARRLQGCGTKTVIVTLGKRGCLAVPSGTPREIPALPVQAVDATAAGDAFNGALAVALAEGQNLDQAVRFATAAAAIAVTRHGAQPSLPSRAEIDAAVRDHTWPDQSE